MICRSGGAEGTDMLFESFCEKYDVDIIAYSFNGHKTKSNHTKILTDDELEEGFEHVKMANKNLKRYIGKLSKYVKNLLSRNWYQVNESDAIFAVGLLKNYLIVDGGTGWAVQEAIDNKKDVFVFEQNENLWYTFSYVFYKFIKIDYIPILTEKFAGIGTREINENGKKAIYDLYKNKFLT